MKLAIVQGDEVLGVIQLDGVPRVGDSVADLEGNHRKVIQVIWSQNMLVGEDLLSAVKVAAKIIVK